MTKSIYRSQPTDEALTLAEVQLHCKVDTEGSPPASEDDSILTALIAVAREKVEDYTELSLINRTHKIALDAFPADFISLETWPVTEITTLRYVDVDGNSQTVDAANYALDNFAKPARLYATDAGWPMDAKPINNAIEIEFKAGFTDSLSPNTYPMPKVLYQAMLLVIGHLYENRQDVQYANRPGANVELPMGSVYLMTPHRINMGM